MKALEVIYSFLLVFAFIAVTMWQIAIESPTYIICTFFVLCFMSIICLCKVFSEIYSENCDGKE